MRKILLFFLIVLSVKSNGQDTITIKLQMCKGDRKKVRAISSLKIYSSRDTMRFEQINSTQFNSYDPIPVDSTGKVNITFEDSKYIYQYRLPKEFIQCFSLEICRIKITHKRYMLETENICTSVIQTIILKRSSKGNKKLLKEFP